MADAVQKLIAAVEARTLTAERQMERFFRATDRRFRNFETKAAQSAARVDQSLSKSFSGLDRLNRGLMMGGGGLGLVLIGRQITGLADDWTRAGNRIAAAGTPVDQVEGQLHVLADLANRSRSGVNETVALYARLTRSSSELGASQADILRVTETVNKALKTGGASAGEAASAVLQLGQALGSGFLQGDELRAIRENSIVLAQAIATEFGVSIGELKKLGEEGKLTSERVFRAILNAADGVDEAFAKTKMTISDSGTLFWNEMTRFVAAADDAAGVSDKLIAIFSAVAHNTDLLAGAVTALATILTARLAAGGIRAAVAGLTAYVAQLRVATAWSYQLGGATRVAGGLAGGMGSTLLRFFGGPIGALVTGVGVALGLYVSSLDDAAQSAAAMAAASNTVNDALDLTARMHGAAADKARDLKKAADEVAESQKKASEAADVHTSSLREQTVATIRNAHALAFMLQFAAQARVTAAQMRLAELAPMVPEDPYDTSGRFDPAHRDEYERILGGMAGLKDAAADAQTKVDQLFTSLSDLINGKIDPPPEGKGAAGAVNQLSKEAEKALKKLRELEAARKAWRDDPAEKYDSRQSLDALSGSSGLGHLDRLMDTQGQRAPMVLEAQEAWRDAFRSFLYDLRSGDIQSAFANLFDAVTARMMDRASDYLADMIFDLVGADTMTSLFGPAEAAQATLAATTQNAAASQAANTAALTAGTSALYNFAAALAAASAKDGVGGFLGALFGGGGGGVSVGAGKGGGAWGLIPKFFDDGGYTGPGAKHQPAGIVHKGEVVYSQDDVRRHGGAARVDAIRRGLPGFANGGVVGVPMRRLPGYAAGGVVEDVARRVQAGVISRARETAQAKVEINGAPMTFAPVINVSGDASPSTVKRLEEMVARQQAEFRGYQASEIQRTRATVRELNERRALRS